MNNMTSKKVTISENDDSIDIDSDDDLFDDKIGHPVKNLVVIGRKKCGWFTGPSAKNCEGVCYDGGEYCEIHDYVNEYSQEQKDQKKWCSGCRKWLYIPGNAKTCGCSNARAKISNEKRAAKNLIENEEKHKEINEKQMETERLIKEEGYIKCPCCKEARPQESYNGLKGITKHCGICRTTQAGRDSNRTRKRDWREERLKDPEAYKRRHA